MNTIKGLSAQNAVTESHLLVKRGSGAQQFTPTTAVNDKVLGFVTRKVGVGELAAVYGTAQITKFRAAGSIAQDANLMPSAAEGKNGYVATAAGAGSTIIGKALQEAADGDLFLALYYTSHGTV